MSVEFRQRTPGEYARIIWKRKWSILLPTIAIATAVALVVPSRSSLQPLVERYGLYQQERQRGEPMESVIESMRKDIHVEVNTSRNDITNGFNITYRGRDPKTTQAVTAELASKFIDAQTQATVTMSTQTKQFFEQQLGQVKEELDEIDKKRLEYMQQHMDNLPSQAAALLGQLNGLREQQKALITEIGRLRDSRTALSTQLNALQQQFEI